MRYKIHYNGKYEDTITIEGDTMGEINKEARQEAEKRGWELKDCWSEEVK